MLVCRYPAIIEGDAETGHSDFFPDIPGCTSGGDKLQEAALNAEQALAGHVALLIESGEKVSAPSHLDNLPRPIEPDVVEASRLLREDRGHGEDSGLSLMRPHALPRSGRAR